MKFPIKTVLLVFVLCLCLWIAAVGQNQRQWRDRVIADGELQTDQEKAEQDPEAQIREKTIPIPKEETPVLEEDDFIGYEQDPPWSRKLFLKKLPALSKKQKIVWAFRMAKKNTLL